MRIQKAALKYFSLSKIGHLCHIVISIKYCSKFRIVFGIVNISTFFICSKLPFVRFNKLFLKIEATGIFYH